MIDYNAFCHEKRYVLAGAYELQSVYVIMITLSISNTYAL